MKRWFLVANQRGIDELPRNSLAHRIKLDHLLLDTALPVPVDREFESEKDARILHPILGPPPIIAHATRLRMRGSCLLVLVESRRESLNCEGQRLVFALRRDHHGHFKITSFSFCAMPLNLIYRENRIVPRAKPFVDDAEQRFVELEEALE